jgi:hypothetical protein
MNLTLLLSKLGLSTSLSQDLTLLLVVIFVSFIFGMFIGRYKLITILINIYVSLSIINAVPEIYFADYSYKLIGFFVLLIALTLAGKKLFEIHISGAGSGFLWRVFAMSFMEVVMLISITLSLVPERIGLEYVSLSSYNYLASENAKLFWLVAPLALMIFIHRRLNR